MVFFSEFAVAEKVAPGDKLKRKIKKTLKPGLARPISKKQAEIERMKAEEKSRQRVSKYYYTYIDRDHTTEENAKNIGAVYLISWGIYPLTQPDTFRKEGSFSNYRENFGKLTFDQDEPFWNWFVHPISGSQLFLYYRANGYSRSQALAMSFISSTLFEFTVEIYTEPASVQDLYQTPILGAVLGVGIENLSMYLLNTGNAVGRFFGHVLNPSTLFWFYEGKVRMVPRWDGKKSASVNYILEF
jgi:hypothetical protein